MSEQVELYPLSTIAEINPSVSIAGLPDNHLISFVGMADVSERGQLRQKHDRFLKEVKAGFTRFKDDDLLFAKITPCMENGKGAHAKRLKSGLGFGSTEFHVLRAKEDAESSFIFQVLQSRELRLKAETRMTGSAGQQRVPSDFFSWYKTYIPSISEQRKIARILTTVDAVIENNEAAIAKFKAIKQGMMHDLFTRGLDENGRLRPRYEDAPHLYKQTELGWVPVAWDVVRIEQVSTLVTNGFVGTATPYYSNSDRGVLYLFGTNIRPNEITFDDIRFVTREFNDKQIKSQLRTGDMLTVQSGHIGTSAIVPTDFIEANCHALIITRFIMSEIYPWFVSYYLNSKMGMKDMEKLFVGSTIKHINTSELARHLILKPHIDEQKSIANKIDGMGKVIQNAHNNLCKMKSIKQGLMSDLLTGTKRVNTDSVM
ncbi:MAG: restriction endonuclease subunit S [Desulfuromonadaceae bacterium]|nr:restriction endonuclease subunit S [Desulfuromonadaceae bacterium]